ncbi:KN motif and ankyrin repeat domain-containing protein 1 isoform X2 [Cephus cinctus]|uniref:KN motif and ankyrin repeat domain-containing protein 1 isoform X2 n=1 Tax=Cephus cinctus TaxID=211228 RepID=A0AAJ7FPX1_CEPCN|nr:KN motif and ankyrin repeat domain-containing protein 1 isoform X2 [Cephus cinctus]
MCPVFSFININIYKGLKVDTAASSDGTITASHMQNSSNVESIVDFDNASIGSGNSNLSTGALQNIREQMAASLERMKELEEQIKVIPMLQVQVSVLKEEKRNLLHQVDELAKSRTRSNNDTNLQRYRSQSFSEEHSLLEPFRTMRMPTRDMGTMCGVMTRDVGVSYQQVRTRDVGMVTSTPIQRILERSLLQVEEILPSDKLDRYSSSRESLKKLERSKLQIENILPESNDSALLRLTRSDLFLENIKPEEKLKKSLNRSPLRIENILPDLSSKVAPSHAKDRKLREFGTNTERILRKNLVCSELRVEEIAPEIRKVPEVQKKSCGTGTDISFKEIVTASEMDVIVENALRVYKLENIPPKKETVSRETQCQARSKVTSDKNIQVAEPIKMKSNVGVTVKPRTLDASVDVKIGPGSRSIGVGPDQVSTIPVSLNSLNSLNSRSHSFNYGDTQPKRKTTKSVGVLVEGLIKTSVRSTDTSGLTPKKREFGTSTLKKKFIDVSVGESVKPHITISCAANYCDNCKETIKTLAKQITNNSENSMNHQISNTISRIPRPSHISLNTPDYRRQFKRQDTYTKIPPAGVIRYDSDNKEQYETHNRLQQLDTEKIGGEKIVPEESPRSEKESVPDEKHELQESALFQPIQEKPRKKVEPSKEMRAAMKVLNDNLRKSPSRNISHQIKNATNVIQQEWFKISSTAEANPLDVEDYLDCFEESSGSLLEYIVNMTDSSGNTAMHYAVSHGNFDVVSILLDSKVCDINKANVAGYTAVMLAALADVRNSTHASVANRLFQLADVNVRAKLHGQTALMLAVSHGRKDMTQLLLDAGAAVNIQDEDGSTALMCAAEHGHTDIVRLLLAHPDCDPSIVDVDGSSALKIALEAGNRDIGVLLYAHEHVNRGTSPYSSMRRSRRGSKPTTPTGASPSAPVSPAPSRRFHSSNISLNSSKYSSSK